MSAPEKFSINNVNFGPIAEMVVSPDDKYMLSLGKDDGFINVIDLASFEVSEEIKADSITTDNILAVASNPERNSFILSDEGNQILSVNWGDLSQKEKIYDTESAMSVIAVNPTGCLIAVSGEDPMVTIIDINHPDIDHQIQIFDNTEPIAYAGFGPVCGTFVILNKEGQMFSYSSSSAYQEPTDHKNKIKTIFQGVCWSKDQLLITDSEKKGFFHVFHFSSDSYVTGKIENLGHIISMSVSDSYLLATCDDRQKIVISRFSDSFIQTQNLPMLYIFDPQSELITRLKWSNNNLYAGDSGGNILKWGPIESEKAKEIEVVKAVLGSDEEIQNIDSEDDTIVEAPSKDHHIVLPNKHAARPHKSMQKHKPSKDSDDIEDLDDLEDLEEEEEDVREKNPYILTSAEESSGAGDDSDERATYSSRMRNATEFRPKRSADDIAKQLEDKFDIKITEYSTTPTVTESESGEETDSNGDRPYTKSEMKEIHKQRQLDQQFIVDGSEVEEHVGEEEDSADIEKLSGSEISEPEDAGPKFIQFMPGSSNEYENKRLFLCHNLIATIFLRENVDDSTSIDVEFSDMSKYKAIHLDNKNDFLMGSVSPTGVVLASRGRVRYISHNKWATDSECVIKMEREEFIDLVAIGDEWFAVSTNLCRLRIFMASGLEIGLINIPQRPMTMVGGGNQLAIVFGNSQYSNDLSFLLLDIKKRTTVASGSLPVQKTVKWIGFDEKMFYVLGNDRILYSLVFDFGTQFVPICNVLSKNGEKVNFWGVGVSDGKFWGIIMPEDREFPEPLPHLQIKGVPLDPQCVDADSKQYLLRRILYCNCEKKDKESMAVKMDTEILRQFAAAEKDRLYERMYQIGLQIKSKKGQANVLNFARQKGPEIQEIADKLDEYWTAISKQEEEEENEAEEAPQNEGSSDANAGGGQEASDESDHAEAQNESRSEEIKKPPLSRYVHSDQENENETDNEKKEESEEETEARKPDHSSTDENDDEDEDSIA